MMNPLLAWQLAKKAGIDQNLIGNFMRERGMAAALQGVVPPLQLSVRRNPTAQQMLPPDPSMRLAPVMRHVLPPEELHRRQRAMFQASHESGTATPMEYDPSTTPSSPVTPPQDVVPIGELLQRYRAMFQGSGGNGASSQEPSAAPRPTDYGPPPFAQYRQAELQSERGPVTDAAAEALQRAEAPPGQEPFEVSAAQESRRNRLESLRDIAEGLGNIKFVSPGEILLGRQQQRDPYVAESLRTRIQEAEDMITPQEAEFYSQQGFKVPVGIRRSVVAGALPQNTAMQRLMAQFSMQQQRLGAEESRFQRGESRRQESLDFMKGRRRQDIRANVASKFLADPDVKYGKQAITKAPIVRRMLNAKNSTQDAAVFSILPRLLGEVGNLSTYEQAKNEKRYGIFNRIKDSWEKNVYGLLSDEQRQGLLGLVDDMEEEAADILNLRAQTAGETWSSVYGDDLPREEVEAMVRPQARRIGEVGKLPATQPASTTQPEAATGRMIKFRLGNSVWEIPEENAKAFIEEYPNASRE